MPTRIQMKRGTAASWAAANPILSDGEIGFETDTSKIKIGNGTSTWTALNYFPADWSALTGKPAVVASGATIQEAKTSINLGNVDNTADADKNVSSALNATNADNAAQATKLTTARTINGVAFDGTENITVPSGIQRSVASSNVALTLPAEASTDYVYFLGGTAPTSVPGDPHWSNVTSLLSFNSTVTGDSATTPPTWTNNATVSLSTAQKRFGASSANFTADGQYLTSSNHSGFSITGTTPFTCEFWFYPTEITNNRILLSMRNTSYICPFIIGKASATYWLWIGNAALNGWEANGVTGNVVFAAYTWSHIAIVGTETEIWLYINGTPVYGRPRPNWATNTAANNGGMFVGGDPWIGWHNGHIDELRFTKGVARYNNFFQTQTASFLTNSSNATPAVYANPTLPTAVNNKNVYTLRNTFSLPLTVNTTSSQTIEGQSTIIIDPGETFNFLSDGSNWRIV